MQINFVAATTSSRALPYIRTYKLLARLSDLRQFGPQGSPLSVIKNPATMLRILEWLERLPPDMARLVGSAFDMLEQSIFCSSVVGIASNLRKFLVNNCILALLTSLLLFALSYIRTAKRSSGVIHSSFISSWALDNAINTSVTRASNRRVWETIQRGQQGFNRLGYQG